MRHDHGHAGQPGLDRARGCTAHGPPDPQGLACGPREDLGVVERGAELSGPRHSLLAVDLLEELELLLEQLLVVPQVVAQQLEQAHAGGTARDQLRAASGDEVEGREVLEDADRVRGAEDRRRAAHPDGPRGLGDGAQDDGVGLGGEELLVALAQAEDVDARGLGGLRVADEFVDALFRAHAGARGGVRQVVAQAVDAEFQTLTLVEAVLVHEVRSGGHRVSRGRGSIN